jgi:hypothetical protein
MHFLASVPPAHWNAETQSIYTTDISSGSDLPAALREQQGNSAGLWKWAHWMQWTDVYGRIDICMSLAAFPVYAGGVFHEI